MIVIPLDVLGVRVELPANTPLVLLREQAGERRLLPIVIGTNEAHAIHSAMQGEVPARPMTHDLMTTVLETTGVTVAYVLITEIRDHTYYAELHLRTATDLVVSCRPSDAVALAVRIGCPVFATEGLMDEASVAATAETEPEGEHEAEEDPDRILDEFRDFLDDLRPEDFG